MSKLLMSELVNMESLVATSSTMDNFQKDFNELASCTMENFELLQSKLNLLVTDLNLKDNTVSDIQDELEELSSTVSKHRSQVYSIIEDTKERMTNIEQDFNHLESKQFDITDMLATVETIISNHSNKLNSLNNQLTIQFILMVILLALCIFLGFKI